MRREGRRRLMWMSAMMLFQFMLRPLAVAIGTAPVHAGGGSLCWTAGDSGSSDARTALACRPARRHRRTERVRPRSVLLESSPVIDSRGDVSSLALARCGFACADAAPPDHPPA